MCDVMAPQWKIVHFQLVVLSLRKEEWDPAGTGVAAKAGETCEG